MNDMSLHFYLFGLAEWHDNFHKAIEFCETALFMQIVI